MQQMNAYGMLRYWQMPVVALVPSSPATPLSTTQTATQGLQIPVASATPPQSILRSTPQNPAVAQATSLSTPQNTVNETALTVLSPARIQADEKSSKVELHYAHSKAKLEDYQRIAKLLNIQLFNSDTGGYFLSCTLNAFKTIEANYQNYLKNEGAFAIEFKFPNEIMSLIGEYVVRSKTHPSGSLLENAELVNQLGQATYKTSVFEKYVALLRMPQKLCKPILQADNVPRQLSAKLRFPSSEFKCYELILPLLFSVADNPLVQFKDLPWYDQVIDIEVYLREVPHNSVRAHAIERYIHLKLTSPIQIPDQLLSILNKYVVITIVIKSTTITDLTFLEKLRIESLDLRHAPRVETIKPLIHCPALASITITTAQRDDWSDDLAALKEIHDLVIEAFSNV